MIHQGLTTLFRTKVLQKNLYKTGRFFKSLKVYVIDYSSDTVVINIEGTDYGLYLLDTHNLLMDFYDDPVFKDYLEEILLKPISLDDITQGINPRYYRFFNIRYNNNVVLRLNL